MVGFGAVPRRCVNLPPGTLRALLGSIGSNRLQSGPELDQFNEQCARWLGVPHVFGTASGRSAFRLALDALNLEQGAEIIFPTVTFPVIPMVAKTMGYEPVFCEVDPLTFNAGPEQIAPKITAHTGAIVATHLFGQACPIDRIVTLAREHGVRVLEDCAHVCGVRIDGRQAGTFGDVGVFSFAEGKNMPCFGGGAIATADDAVAERAAAILSKAPLPSKSAILKMALSIWGMWWLTRPSVFGLTVYPSLRLKLRLGQPLMDSAVGDELLENYHTPPQIRPLSNLQATIGLLQLQHIDAFNEGAQRNAQHLTDELLRTELPGVTAPRVAKGEHIYVYYPLTVDPSRRDDLRHYLLRHGIDSKTTDMSDCSGLTAFRDHTGVDNGQHPLVEASIIEFCVYPTISASRVQHIADTIRAWAASDRVA